MGDKNIFFNSVEETRLKNHFENDEINQFNAIIVGKICDKYEDNSTESWELLMNVLESAYAKSDIKDLIATFPESDKAILAANMLYLTIDGILH